MVASNASQTHSPDIPKAPASLSAPLRLCGKLFVIRLWKIRLRENRGFARYSTPGEAEGAMGCNPWAEAGGITRSASRGTQGCNSRGEGDNLRQSVDNNPPLHPLDVPLHNCAYGLTARVLKTPRKNL